MADIIPTAPAAELRVWRAAINLFTKEVEEEEEEDVVVVVVVCV